MISTVTITFGAAVIAYLILSKAFGRAGRNLPLPPGPKPQFIYGNARDIPHEKPWVEFHNWGKKYGGLIYFTIFRTKFIVLNDPKIAFALLDKRSLLYSDRPRSVMIDLIGWGST
ncbi:hypothetical protein BDZ97DRAFT_1431706 [Flammula alnicola]|nr:hypothetical protein BDZ97DRAFT_1431706 [Flammula alnicola]